MLPIGLGDNHFTACISRCLGRTFRTWPRQANLNPLAQGGDFVIAQPGVGGHFALGCMADRFDQQAALRIPGNRGRSGTPPFEQVCQRCQPQVPFRIFVAMAFQALGGEHGMDVLLEKLVRGLIVAFLCERGCAAAPGSATRHKYD